jgi:Pyruvate/2-oxoacid:ferredoxin oxidoreductase delta subunit
VVAQRKAQWHHQAGHDVITFAAMLLDVWRTVRPALTILDGVWGMEGQGPANGRPRRFGLLAAAADPLVMDLNLALMLGLNWRHYPLAQAAAGLGLIPRPLPLPVWLGPEAGPEVFAAVDIPRQRRLGFLPGFLEGIVRRHVVCRPEQNPGRCLLCRKCLQICPEKCIEERGGRLKFNYYKCIRCYCCQEVCPADAISLRPGLLEKTLRVLGR